ncbi:RagB/SusD family nutrient uptake outer membrane protein [Pedobacter cryoconitis]|uniref:SusD-like starch-binding protein associating with outer membrane n=1 Tax=Pedobacter cryoconitis TaxID=188932 RepID=A0A7X0J3I5_9SPHI|nr:RagB/SusD family nutrient uptake outer membrane protein [Pedobacter cryoconitis]MBB6498971.1 hypothetical protein [Pedobacter cryoconitis]
MNNQTFNKMAGITACLSFILILAINFSCKKYLEEKSDKKISTPSSITDLEGLLDNYGALNARFPSAGEISSDNYYLKDGDWSNLPERQRNFYLWQKWDDIGGDWLAPYNNIFYANVILEVLKDLSTDNNARTKQIEGSALFIRSYNHFVLSQLFAVPYDGATASRDLGIPIRLKSDPNIFPTRVSILETYNSILADAKAASGLLSPDLTLKYHPSRQAAYALISRVYLNMREYEKAELYADSCLSISNKLIDYNSLIANSAIPFGQFNDEVIYDARTAPPTALSASKARIDSNLTASYEPNDLRKTVFFKTNPDGTKSFKGNYTGLSSAALFSGFATDEMYLTRAECRARAGNVLKAMEDLNFLLKTRWRIDPKTQKTTYVDQFAANSNEALKIILLERRKQLLYRNIRWSDLRRLNKEERFARSIYRRINNKIEELLPNSARYTLQIDRQAVNLSGVIQNP